MYGRMSGQAVLVHCKMGISRSGSTVIAYAMKQEHWPLDVALAYVKDRRSIVKPNEGFMKQLQIYNGILNARSDVTDDILLEEELDTKMSKYFVMSCVNTCSLIVAASSVTAHCGGESLKTKDGSHYTRRRRASQKKKRRSRRSMRRRTVMKDLKMKMKMS